MEPFFEKLIRHAMETCKTESPREVRMVAAWIRADADASGSVTTKEVSKLFKVLNIPYGSSTIKDLTKKYSEHGVANDGARAISREPDDGDDKEKHAQLSFLQFRAMWRAMDTFPEIERHFSKAATSYTMTLQDLTRYLQQEQHADAAGSEDRAKRIMERYGELDDSRNKVLGMTGFVSFVINPEYNTVVSKRRTVEVVQDMTRPIHEYFMASSHNTYLRDHQLYGESSPDMYKNALMWGCRCVEIDCWDGPNGEPVVYHGYTRTTKISFESVCKAINEHAFSKSDYPVLLSLEVHTSIEQQKRMAEIMRRIFGDTLHPSVHSSTLRMKNLSPEALKRRILVKGKICTAGSAGPSHGVEPLNENDPDDSELSDEKADQILEEKKKQKKKGSGGKKHAVAQELSDCVFLVSVKVKDPSDMEGSMPYDIVSMVEGRIDDLYKDHPSEVAEMNKRMMTRVYPAGTRISSENYDPQPAWNMGCQVVALNYQTQKDEHLRHYIGRFRDNGGCGYVLKPPQLRDPKLQFNAFDKAPEHHLRITIARALRLPKHGRKEKGGRVDPYIELVVSGIERDVFTCKTHIVKDNGYNPVYDFSKTLRFRCLDMATIILRACDDNGDVLAEAVIPATCIEEGLRSVKMWDGAMKPCQAVLLLKTQWVQGGPEKPREAARRQSAQQQQQQSPPREAPAPALKLSDVNYAPQPEGGQQGRGASNSRSPLAAPQQEERQASSSPPRAAQAGGAPASGLMMGQVVLALWGGEQWRAKVVQRGVDEHYVVQFDDNSRATMHAKDLTETPAPTNPQVPYFVRQRVLAAWGDEGWFPATLTHINPDTSCAVEWEDGSGWNIVPLDYLRPAP